MSLNIPQIIVVAGTLPWLAYIMVRPRILTIIVVLLSIIQLNWFARYFGAPAVFSRFSLVAAGLLGIRLLVDFSLSKKYFVNKWLVLTPVLWLTCFFLLLTFFSNILNGESLLLGFYELRYYFFGFVICFALYFYFNDILSIIFFKQIILWIGVAQVPVSILKWLVAGGGRALTLDSVTGTFAGYGELVGSQIFVICIILFEELTSKKRLLRINNYLLCLIILLPLLLSKSRTATLYVALAFGFSWLLGSLQKKNFALVLKQTVSVFFLGICVFFLLYQFFWKPNYDVRLEFNPSHVFEYFMRDPITDYETYREGNDPVMGRIRAVVEAMRLVSEHPVNLFVGYGSGATAEASFLGIRGKYYQDYGLFAGLGINHYSKTIAEFGLLGMGGFIFFYTALYFRITNYAPARTEYTNIFSLLLFTLALLSIYGATLTSFYFNFVVASLLATVQKDLDVIVNHPTLQKDNTHVSESTESHHN